jgi:hypothetical protein
MFEEAANAQGTERSVPRIVAEKAITSVTPIGCNIAGKSD